MAPRIDQFPLCMSLHSKMEPCVGYSEARTRLDLEEKENAKLRTLLKECDDAFAALNAHGYHPMRSKIQTSLAE